MLLEPDRQLGVRGIAEAEGGKALVPLALFLCRRRLGARRGMAAMLRVRRRRGRMAVPELGGCSRSFGWVVVVVSVGLSTES